MARDKRGRLPEPDPEEVLDELAAEEGGSEGEFIAGPTSRNEAGDTKRAAAKANPSEARRRSRSAPVGRPHGQLPAACWATAALQSATPNH